MSKRCDGLPAGSAHSSVAHATKVCAGGVGENRPIKPGGPLPWILAFPFPRKMRGARAPKDPDAKLPMKVSYLRSAPLDATGSLFRLAAASRLLAGVWR